jgi:hypothetical protein
MYALEPPLKSGFWIWQVTNLTMYWVGEIRPLQASSLLDFVAHAATVTAT